MSLARDLRNDRVRNSSLEIRTRGKTIEGIAIIRNPIHTVIVINELSVVYNIFFNFNETKKSIAF